MEPFYREQIKIKAKSPLSGQERKECFIQRSLNRQLENEIQKLTKEEAKTYYARLRLLAPPKQYEDLIRSNKESETDFSPHTSYD
jgi:hypothetical protein